MRKALAILLAVMLLATALPAMAAVVEDESVTSVKTEYDSGEGCYKTTYNGGDFTYESEVEFTGSVTAGGVNVNTYAATEGADSFSLEVDGDVTNTAGDAVYAKGAKATVTVGGDVETTGIGSRGVSANNSSTVNVGGDVEATGIAANGVCAATSSTVTVGGSVAADGEGSYGAYAYEGSVTVGDDVEVEGNGSIGAYAYNGSVTVDGNVTAEGKMSAGVSAENGCTVTVGGDVTAEGERSAGVCAYDGSTVTVVGDVVDVGGNFTVLASTNSTVRVGYTYNTNYVGTGEWVANEELSSVTGANGVVANGSGSTLNINGNVTATNETNGLAIYATGTDSTVVVEGDVSGVYAVVMYDNMFTGSTIVIGGEVKGQYGIETEDGITEEADMTEAQSAALKQAVNFIVARVLGEGVDAEDVVLSDTETLKGFDVANEGDEVTLTVSNASNYNVTIKGTGEVVDNDDGSYTITVQRGGVQVIVELAETPEPDPDPKKKHHHKHHKHDDDDDETTYTVTSVTVVELNPVFSEEAYVPAEGEALEIKTAIPQGADYIKENLAKTVVKVEGEALEADAYTAEIKDGELVISFTNEYLETLDAGEHTVEIVIGSASFKVTLEKTDAGEYIVKAYVEAAEA